MEKALFREKVDAMMPDLINAIRKECDRLYDCGGCNPPDFEDNYLLPKITLTVALERQAWQYSPLCDAHKKIVRNLRHF